MAAATSLAALICLSGPTAHADTIFGIPRIVDGDTVEIGSTKIRLHGIDAPETDQLCLDAKGAKWACGIAARDALAAFASVGSWSCNATGHDRYGRTLASCSSDGLDIGQWMARPDAACTIKAGLNHGKCIYHLTGDRWYAKMKMAKPDRRWFCSEKEAEEAGCRAPKR